MTHKQSLLMGRFRRNPNRIYGSDLKPQEWPSTAIASLDYDVENRQVTIVFQQRGTYTYFDVPPEVFAELNHAGSRGTYFNEYFKNNYEYERVA